MASQSTMTFTASMLYETAYSIPFSWQNHLPHDIYDYHSLVWRETNAPIELHMGIVLPFVSACLGPRTKGLFLIWLTVLNLFWINVATSGVGKSVMRHRFISQPLDFMINKSGGSVPDFQISRFTCSGMYDNYVFFSTLTVFTISLQRMGCTFYKCNFFNLSKSIHCTCDKYSI